MATLEHSLVLVTPTHKADFTEQEEIFLGISLESNSNLTHCFVVPDDLDVTEISQKFSNSQFKRMPKEYFQSAKAYNRLMLSNLFYEQFADYRYLLVIQLDALLLRSIRSEDYDQYDYVGAPWRKTLRVSLYKGDLHANNKKLFWLPCLRVSVGNGGLSFRKVSGFLELLRKSELKKFDSRVWDGSHNEDFVLSYFLKKFKYRVPRKRHARNIFQEEDFEHCVDTTALLGVHAPQRYNPVLTDQLIHKLNQKR
jgi:hypothetical protein